jgi:hypothetical protein
MNFVTKYKHSPREIHLLLPWNPVDWKDIMKTGGKFSKKQRCIAVEQ